MEEKYKLVQEKLKKYNQEQLLNRFEQMNSVDKNKLLDEILQLDFEQIQNLYKKVNSKTENIEDKIEPIECVEKDKLPDDKKEKYEKIGVDLIKEGKYAVVTMAGGQGTRLGHNGPKGTYKLDVDGEKAIFEILCDKLKQAREKYGTYVPWYIMTSNQNNEETIKFFEKNNYFDYPKNCVTFFTQGELPVIDENGKILLNDQGFINKAADGHGGIFISLRKNGLLYDMKARNIQWAFVCGVDNILVNMVDPILVGLAVDKNVLAAGKSLIKAYPEERVGVFCKKNDKPSVIEYTEISKEMAEETKENGELKYAESHILCNLFNVEAIEEISKDKLPYHPAHKKIEYMDRQGNIVNPENPNAYKFEAFLFDAFESLDSMVIMRVKREEEFAPVKNAEGVDSPETAIKLYREFYGIE